MTVARQVGCKTKFKVHDRDCIGRACFAPGEYQVRGATGGSGSRNTGEVWCMCMTWAYRGCPIERPVDAALLKQRKADGWKAV